MARSARAPLAYFARNTGVGCFAEDSYVAGRRGKRHFQSADEHTFLISINPRRVTSYCTEMRMRKNVMTLLTRLSKLLTREEKMSSVSVYRRADHFYVVTLHGSGGGDPCIEAGPLESLSTESLPAELGAAIVRSLNRTTHSYPYPASQQAWKQVTAPLLEASRCKSWATFAKKAANLRIDRRPGHKITVSPSVRDAKGAFSPVAEREQHLETPTEEQLGALVAAELKR
jgi:hypothetical protein